jgi:hypothetical protein
LIRNKRPRKLEVWTSVFWGFSFHAFRLVGEHRLRSGKPARILPFGTLLSLESYEAVFSKGNLNRTALGVGHVACECLTMAHRKAGCQRSAPRLVVVACSLRSQQVSLVTKTSRRRHLNTSMEQQQVIITRQSWYAENPILFGKVSRAALPAVLSESR